MERRVRPLTIDHLLLSFLSPITYHPSLITFMANSYQSIKFRVEDRVGRISFERPPLNIFNIAMMKEVADAVTECAGRRELVAILFEAGAGSRAFSAGVAVEEHVEET